MYKSGLVSPFVDPTANLTEQQKIAAAKAGYAVPYLTDEAKFAMAQAERRNALKAADDATCCGISPRVK